MIIGSYQAQAVQAAVTAAPQTAASCKITPHLVVPSSVQGARTTALPSPSNHTAGDVGFYSFFHHFDGPVQCAISGDRNGTDEPRLLRGHSATLVQTKALLTPSNLSSPKAMLADPSFKRCFWMAAVIVLRNNVHRRIKRAGVGQEKSLDRRSIKPLNAISAQTSGVCQCLVGVYKAR